VLFPAQDRELMSWGVDVQVRAVPVASEMTSMSEGPFWSPDSRLVAMASSVPSAVRAIEEMLWYQWPTVPCCSRGRDSGRSGPGDPPAARRSSKSQTALACSPLVLAVAPSTNVRSSPAAAILVKIVA
jgi:hypothetical protein